MVLTLFSLRVYFKCPGNGRMSDFYEEACYLSNGEADDSEAEEFAPMGHLSPTPRKQPIPAKESGELAWDDPAALLSTWLGELDSLQMVSAPSSSHSIINIHQRAYYGGGSLNRTPAACSFLLRFVCGPQRRA